MGSDADDADTVELGSQLRRLFDDHYRSLTKLAGFYLDDPGACEEVVQDAFVAALSGRRHVTPGSEAAYLRSTVLNGARSQLRRRQVRERHRPIPEPHGDTPEGAALARAARDDVLAAIRRLPTGQADVVLLRYYLDLTEAEIADTLGIARGTVKSHAHRGLARLAELLEAHR